MSRIHYFAAAVVAASVTLSACASAGEGDHIISPPPGSPTSGDPGSDPPAGDPSSGDPTTQPPALSLNLPAGWTLSVSQSDQGEVITLSRAADPAPTGGEIGPFELAELIEAILPVTQTTVSFLASCRLPAAFSVSITSGTITAASSSGGCKQPTGTFGSASAFSGSCTEDVSNCNGKIVCQSRCQ